MKLNLELTGRTEFERILKGLPKEVDRQFFTSLQREQLQPVAKDMRSRLAQVTNERTGNLMRSIGVRTLPRKSRLGTGTLVGQRYGIYRGFHAPLIEGGRKAIQAKKGRMLRFVTASSKVVVVRSVGAQRARPFIGPAIQHWLPVLELQYPTAVTEHLEKFMKRYAKK